MQQQYLKKYNALKFKDLIEYQTCVLMYKASNNMLPTNIQTQFCKNQDMHRYSTRNKSKLYVTSVKSSIKQTSVNITGVKLWNSLEQDKKKFKLKVMW